MSSPEAGASSGAVPARTRPSADDAQMYRRIVEATSEGIWVVDTDGKTTFANDKASEILGYGPAELAELSLFDVFDEAGQALAAERLERRRQGISDQEECEVIRKDGSRLSVRFAGSPLYDDNGNYAGVIGMMRDITQRQLLDGALRLREQQLAEAQQVAHLGSWEWDIASDVVAWSDEMYRSFGLEPQGFVATLEGYLDRVHPDDREMIAGQVSGAFEGGAFGFDHRILRADGKLIWIRAQGQVVRDADGTPIRMHGTGHDITESRRVEVALREATARYRLLQVMAVASNEAASVQDALQIAVNEICSHTGWAAGHAYLAEAGRLTALPTSHRADTDELARLLSAAGQDPDTAVAADALAAGTPKIVFDLGDRSESAALRMAQGLGLRAVLAFPVLLAGEVVAVLEFFSELESSPAELLLEAIAQVGTQLARVVERQRASDNLATARDAAMEASRLKSEFLATMSHEIRTPMNGVMGLTELLLDTDLDERQQQFAEGVRGAGEALLGIINDILDFSKIEAGRLDLDVVDFDLLATIDQVADLVAETARGKGLELLTHCRADLPTRLRGDQTRIRQVLINLAANAVKFTETGEVVIRARLLGAEGGSSDDIVARFEITDTGEGILTKDQDRLFEPFTQADASTTRRFGGTGLGLAISRQLVAALGGEIGVDSVVGHGSTFWFTVPLQRQPNSGSPLSRSNHEALKGLRVLIVDDSDTSRMILREQLGAWGMSADSARDGWVALDRLRAAGRTGEPYHLVIMDREMPSMDGVELAEQIAEDPTLASTQLILLTAATETSAEMARSAIVAAQVTKPVRQGTLHDRLLQVLTAHPDLQTTSRSPRSVSATVSGQVLVVEDNSVNQLVARGMLANLGYGSDVAGNGIEALAAMATTDYVAVLMDCHMPGMDGYVATGEIRRIEGGSKHTPIIALTANAIMGDRQRCIDAGMDDYLAKPISSKALDNMLARWLEPTAGA